MFNIHAIRRGLYLFYFVLFYYPSIWRGGPPPPNGERAYKLSFLKFRGIGAALLAFGIQLSIDYGYGGAIYLKAKTSAIREHYIRDFGAVPFSYVNPFILYA